MSIGMIAIAALVAGGITAGSRLGASCDRDPATPDARANDVWLLDSGYGTIDITRFSGATCRATPLYHNGNETTYTMAIGHDRVWFWRLGDRIRIYSIDDDGRVKRTGTVSAREIDGDTSENYITAGFGRLWRSSYSRPLVGVEPTGRQAPLMTRSLTTSIDDLAQPGAGAVWSVAITGDWPHRYVVVQRIDPRTGRVSNARLRRYTRREEGASGLDTHLVVGDRHVWAFDPRRSRVHELNRENGTIMTTRTFEWPRTDSRPAWLWTPASDRKSIWIGAGRGGRLEQYDIASGRQVRTLNVTPGLSRIAAARDWLYVVASGRKHYTLYRVDPETGDKSKLRSLDRPQCCMPEPPIIATQPPDP